jgi:hypothetical protein
MLPVWRRDLKTLGAAWRFRREVMESGVRRSATERSERRRWRERRRVIFTGFLGLALGVGFVLPAFAVEAEQVVYSGGGICE